MNQPDFVHLHVHTAYSLLDSSCRIPELVSRVKALGMTACAITDHGNLFGAVAFYEECVKQGIKPIIGCEVYVREFSAPEGYPSRITEHLILLCENQIGYHNLCRLISLGYKHQTTEHPVVSMAEVKRYAEGLIALSGCMEGHIARCLLRDEYQIAKKDALTLAEIFSRGRFYLEIFDHGEPQDAQLKRAMIRLSNETGIPLAATNDVHFIHPGDVQDHQILCWIAGAAQTAQPHSNAYYLKSQQEMEQLMIDCPTAIYNTFRIAGRCNLRFDFETRLLPEFHKDGVEDNAAYLKYRAYKGLQRRYENVTDALKERLAYELSVIEQMGFVDYFLIVADFISYARKNDIPVGPGRGSGAGSLVAYCIGITQIDPIRYGLLFERFLNPERVSMPDFDIDFCYERRGEVIDYICRKYGEDHVAQIVTFGTLSARACIRDVGRVLHMDTKLYNDVSRMMPSGSKMTIDQGLQENRALKELYDTDDRVRRLLDACRRIEGLPRHTATHAAGIVITPKAVDEYVPLAKNDDVMVTQYNMNELEHLGLLKIDFLGLRNLTVLHDCEAQIRKFAPDFSLSKISFSEESVYEMLSRGETDGVFQLESDGIRRVLIGLQPESFEDIIAVIALYRPGPMESIPDYIKRRHAPQTVSYLHPTLIPILKETYGCIVYQEQVMQICRELAGYSYGRADIVRRAMAKKKTDVMEKERAAFLEGCAQNGVEQGIAEQIFDQMAAFASYAFNKSHAAAYAYLTYQTAYCRRFYPVQFYLALMNAFYESPGKLEGYVISCRSMGIPVLAPDVNVSQPDFTEESGGIRFGLCAVKSVGISLAQRIADIRDADGKFTDFEDFCRRVVGKDCTRQGILSLVMAGACDCFSAHNRNEMLSVCEELLMGYYQGQRSEIAGQLSLFEHASQPQQVTWPKCEPPVLMQRLEQERKVLGFGLSGHPLDEVDERLLPDDLTEVGALAFSSEQPPGKELLVLGILSGIRMGRTKKGTRMAAASFSDRTGKIELVIYETALNRFGPMIKEGVPLVVGGTLRHNDGNRVQLIAGSLVPPERIREVYGNAFLQRNQSVQRAARIVYIKARSSKDPRIPLALGLFAAHPGVDEVCFYFADTGQYVPFRQGRISFDKTLENQLKNLFGNKEIVDKIRKKTQTS